MWSFGAWILATVLSGSFLLKIQKVILPNLFSRTPGFSLTLIYLGVYTSWVGVFLPSLKSEDFSLGAENIYWQLSCLHFVTEQSIWNNYKWITCAMDILLLASLNYVIYLKCLKLKIRLVDNCLKCKSDKTEINGNSWENLSFELEYAEITFKLAAFFFLWLKQYVDFVSPELDYCNIFCVKPQDNVNLVF